MRDAQVISEEFTVREQSGARPDVEDGVLVVDKLTPERASMVALTVAQSAAMEYYERIVEDMFVRTDRIVNQLETPCKPPRVTSFTPSHSSKISRSRSFRPRTWKPSARRTTFRTR